MYNVVRESVHCTLAGIGFLKKKKPTRARERAKQTNKKKKKKEKNWSEINVVNCVYIQNEMNVGMENVCIVYDKTAYIERYATRSRWRKKATHDNNV